MEKAVDIKSLKTSIQKATTSDQLLTIVNSIVKQNNGHASQVASHLGDAFWYDDLIERFGKQKAWMIKICESYK